MASTAISAVTTLITGQAPPTAHATTFASGDTITVYGPSGGDLDFNTLSLRVVNSSSATAAISLTASESFTDYTLGDASITVGTSATVYIGGEDFDSARFKHVASSGTVYAVITAGATVGLKVEAVQAPYSHTG